MHKLTKLNIRWFFILALAGGLMCALPVMAQEEKVPSDPLENLEPDAVWDPVQEQWLMPEDVIEAEEEAASAGSRDDQELIGEPFEDWVYTAVNPCIIVDTRYAGGPISASFTRGFNVYGSLGGQGGAYCPLPSGKPAPRAVHINLIAIPVSGGNGNIRAYPDGAPTSDGLSVNFNSGLPVNIANAGTVKTNTGGGTDIRVRANGATSNVKIEVLGYYFDSQSVVGGDALNSAGGCAALTATDTVLRSIQMSTNVTGEFFVTGNGYFELFDTSTYNRGRCSIETGTTITASQAVEAEDYQGRVMDSVPFAVTRTFRLSAGNHSFRLVCDEINGNVNVCNPRIHAIFYQKQY